MSRPVVDHTKESTMTNSPDQRQSQYPEMPATLVGGDRVRLGDPCRSGRWWAVLGSNQ
jgi:hypothetical protein